MVRGSVSMVVAALMAVVLLASASATATTTTAPRAVRWYLNAGRVDDNVAFVKAHRDAITGAYPCCNLMSINATGGFATRHSASTLKSWTAPLAALGVDVIPVAGLSQAAVQNGTAVRGVADMVAQLAALNVSGVMVDYEPASNYTMAHVDAYTAFLKALGAALHAAQPPMVLGVDVASWGILKYWSAYAATGADILMSMSPTYSGANVTLDKEVVSAMLAGGITTAQLSTGIATSVVPPTTIRGFNWTATSLPAFVSWLEGEGVREVDVWRADIDHYETTQPFFFDVLSGFLAGKA